MKRPPIAARIRMTPYWLAGLVVAVAVVVPTCAERAEAPTDLLENPRLSMSSVTAPTVGEQTGGELEIDLNLNFRVSVTDSVALAQGTPHPGAQLRVVSSEAATGLEDLDLDACPISGELERDIEGGGRDDPKDAACFSPPADLCHMLQVVAVSYCGRPVVR